MKPTEFTVILKSENVLDEIQKLRKDLEPLIESVIWAAVEEIKWIYRI
jgi:hypothetical protein